MKKTIFLSLLIIMATVQLHAQLMISISPPAPINLRSSALFNATLINSGSDIRLYFKGSIINTVNGKKILEGQSIPMDFAKGTHMLNEAKLQPVYSFYDESFRETGFAPYGNYEICLQAYVISNNEEVGNGCTSVEVTPTTPPLLISPDDGSVIYEQYPLLTWLAPTPVQRFGSILYDLKLVEIMQNQTAYDAIQRNFAILDMKDLKSTFLQYPVTATKLDTSKQYVWKVLAKTATGNLIGETEIWKFRYSPADTTEDKSEVITKSYILPVNPNIASIVNVGNELKIKLEHYRSNNFPVFRIIDQSEKLLPAELVTVISEGEGRFYINLKGSKAFSNKKLYKLLVKYPGQSESMIYFRYIKQSN